MARAAFTGGNKLAKIEGLPELQRNIATVIDAATGEKVRQVWMAAAKIVRDRARTLAPELAVPHKGHVAGILKRAIFAADGDKGKPNVIVGVAYGIAPHAHWMEYGTGERSTGIKKGRKTGKLEHRTGVVKPQPYMRPALAQTRQAMISSMADGYRKLLAEAV
jgi:HK97 gp10 family phage protein